jgi:hypothetical protein
MPISHRVMSDPPLMLIRRWGAIDTQDERAACAAREADPRVVPGLPVLVDTTEVEQADTVEVIRYLADCVTHSAAALRCGPVAIVVASDVEYGMGRMYMALTELAHPDTEVFRSLQAARRWLARRTGDARLAAAEAG